jgi:hypothetical protein
MCLSNGGRRSAEQRKGEDGPSHLARIPLPKIRQTQQRKTP